MGTTVQENVEQNFALTKVEAFVTIARIVGAIIASALVLLSTQIAHATDLSDTRLFNEAREIASANRDRCDFSCHIYSDDSKDLDTCFKMQSRCESGFHKTARLRKSKKIVSTP